MEPQEFRDLIGRIRAGDAEAAATLVRAFEPELWRYVRIRLTDARLRRVLDSMDVCQSVRRPVRALLQLRPQTTLTPMIRIPAASLIGGASMKWKLVCTVSAVLVFVGVTMADNFTGIITEVKDGKVTFYKGSFNKEEKKFEKSDKATTLPVASDAKVTRGKFDKDAMKFVAGDPIEGGLKNEMFDKIGEKGVFASITTDADNKKITEISVFGKKKGGGK
jgi:hypothetical protein